VFKNEITDGKVAYLSQTSSLVICLDDLETPTKFCNLINIGWFSREILQKIVFVSHVTLYEVQHTVVGKKISQTI